MNHDQEHAAALNMDYWRTIEMKRAGQPRIRVMWYLNFGGYHDWFTRLVVVNSMQAAVQAAQELFDKGVTDCSLCLDMRPRGGNGWVSLGRRKPKQALTLTPAGKKLLAMEA